MASIFSGKSGRLAANAALASSGAAYNQAKTDLGAGNTGFNDQVTSGYNKADDFYRQAGDLYGPNGMYGKAVGLGGAGGTADAMTAFRGANPGYQFQYDQGLQALNRQAAAGGRGASGNALMAAQSYGTGLADQSYNKWLDNLYRSTVGQSQAFDARGRLASSYGDTMGGQAYRYGSDLANLGTNYGDKSASIQAGGMMAGQQAAANRFGATMGALGLIGQGLGGLAGNANALSNIGSNFGSIFKGFGS